MKTLAIIVGSGIMNCGNNTEYSYTLHTVDNNTIEYHTKCDTFSVGNFVTIDSTGQVSW